MIVSDKTVNLAIVLVFIIGISLCLSVSARHHLETKSLIEAQKKTPAGPLSKPEVGTDDLERLEKHLKGTWDIFYRTLLFYLPSSIIAVSVGFLLALWRQFHAGKKRAAFARVFVQLVDSIPLVFWIFLLLIVMSKMTVSIHIFNEYPRIHDFLDEVYYPALSISYGIVLWIIFYRQDSSKIAELQRAKIIDQEKLYGIGDWRIVLRMLRYRFFLPVFLKQVLYSFLYLNLFDYCFMVVYEGRHARVAEASTTLAFEAGRFYHLQEYYRDLQLHAKEQIYSCLHLQYLWLIICMAFVSFMIMFYFYDKKELFHD